MKIEWQILHYREKRNENFKMMQGDIEKERDLGFKVEIRIHK